MKVVIFAGGLGTRISEETDTRPKPMVEIGGKPILWHIMKIYSQYGFNDFVICLGYKGYMIKEYFMHYYMHNSDITIELNSNKMEVHYTATESFNVTLVDTGLSTKTAGRLKKVEKFIGNEDFMLTYGDGVADINITELLEFHKQHGKIATVTAVQPEARFGAMELGADGSVKNLRKNRWVMANGSTAGFSYFLLKCFLI
jgi:glucose-1-phosphate cytidylyltransferase